MKDIYYKCESCFDVFEGSKLLEAVSPFDPVNMIYGCPKCKDINTFIQVCDEPHCKNVATCGTPTEQGYRHVCGNHYREIVAVK